MTTLIAATRDRLDHSEGLRLAVLSGLSFLLGLVFVVLLLADEAHAAL